MSHKKVNNILEHAIGTYFVATYIATNNNFSTSL